MIKSKNKQFVKNVLQKIKTAYNLKTDADLARYLGMQPNTLAMQKKRGSLNWFRILEKCRDLDKNWLLHENQFTNNQKSPMRVQYIHQSNLTLKHLSSKHYQQTRQILVPSYLFPEEIVKDIDLEECLLVKVNRSKKLTKIKSGDVMLLHTDIEEPQDNEYHVVAHKGHMRITRIAYKTKYQLILKDQDRNRTSTNDPVTVDSKDIALLGHVLWMGFCPSRFFE